MRVPPVKKLTTMSGSKTAPSAILCRVEYASGCFSFGNVGNSTNHHSNSKQRCIRTTNRRRGRSKLGGTRLGRLTVLLETVHVVYIWPTSVGSVGQTVPWGASRCLESGSFFCRGRAQNHHVSLLSNCQFQSPDMLQLALHFGSGNQRLPTEEQASSLVTLVPRRRDLVMSGLTLEGKVGKVDTWGKLADFDMQRQDKNGAQKDLWVIPSSWQMQEAPGSPAAAGISCWKVWTGWIAC